MTVGFQDVAEGVIQKTDQQWSYSGKTGPEYWGLLDPTFSKCSMGLEQSPININTGKVNTLLPFEVKISYSPSIFRIKSSIYTIEGIPLDQQKNTLWIKDVPYYLKQFHFHNSSEHELNNTKFPLEIHLVHESPHGNLAVVGLFVKQGEPNDKGVKYLEGVKKNNKKAIFKEIDITELLPMDKSTYTYEGSLTTPPCTEGVKWFLLSEPIVMTQHQIGALSEQYPSNFRPLQPINNRDVYKSSLKSIR